MERPIWRRVGEGGCLPGGTSRGTKGSFERVAAGGSLPPMALLSTTGISSPQSPCPSPGCCWVALRPCQCGVPTATLPPWAGRPGAPLRRSLEETFPQAVVLRQVAWEGVSFFGLFSF